MAVTNTINIKFKPEGSRELTNAIKTLDKATKSLIGSQIKLAAAQKQSVQSTEKLKKGLFETQHSTRILGGAFSVLRSKLLLAAFAATLFQKSIGRLIKASAQQENAEKLLSTALGRRSEELLRFASAQQQVTTFGDEETIQAMSLIAAYTENESAIKRLTQASMDLAIAKGMDLNTAVDLVAKSVFSSTNALSRYGVTIQGAQGSTERLESATKALSEMYAGQATAASETLDGSITSMKNAMGDTAESMGTLLEPVIIVMANNLQKASEHADEFLKGLNNLVKFGTTGGLEQIKEQSDRTAEGYRNLNRGISELNERALKLGLDIKKLNKEALIDEEGRIRTTRERAEFMQKAINREIAQQKELQKIADAPSEEALFLDELLRKQTEIANKKQEEKDQVDFLIEMYPELAAQLGLIKEKTEDSTQSMEKMAELAAGTAGSLLESALMGDDLTEALKRAAVRMLVMVAEAKLYAFFMEKAKKSMEAVQTGGLSTIFSAVKSVGNLLFGHTGGLVTAGGIKRFHSGGLANDEMPAILQRGEFVLSKRAVDSIGLDSVRNMNEGRGQSVQINIQGGIVDRDYVSNELLPAITKAKALA